jgi:integrase
MSVHLKPDGRWFAVWIDHAVGKQLRRYFGRGPDAERLARDFDASNPARRYDRRTPPPGSTTFAELANAYSESRLGIMEKVSLDNWLWKMKGVIFPAIGHLPAMEITPERLDRYVSERLKAPRDPKRPERGTIKRTTVHRELSDIRAVLNWSARRRYIPFNPSAAYEMPKRDDAIVTPPTAAELSGILQHASDRLARAILIAYYTGIRPGPRELFSLKWDDADLDAATLTIRSARKNGLRVRVVPIHRALLPLLIKWKAGDHPPGAPQGATIIHDHGLPIASIKKAFQGAKERAGITRKLPLYSIRHAFASESLRARADLKSVSALLGHTRTDTTTRIYQHLNDADARAAIDRLPAIDAGQSLVNYPEPEIRTIH